MMKKRERIIRSLRKGDVEVMIIKGRKNDGVVEEKNLMGKKRRGVKECWGKRIGKLTV